MQGSGGSKKAIVISVSDYDILRPLSFCKNDGDEMYKVLKSLNYEILPTSKLIGRVQREEMRHAIIDFFLNKNVRPNDTLLFYYSGHGILDGYGDHYFATSALDPFQPDTYGFLFDELTRMIDKSNSRKIVIILDCCYSGAARIGKGDEEDVANAGRAAINEKSRLLERGEGRWIIAASQAYQKAFETMQKNHSLFTYYLLQALSGKEELAGDKDGYITVETLSSYLYNAILDLPSEKRPPQTPIRKVEGSGDIILGYYPILSKKAKTEQKIDSATTDIQSDIDKGKAYFDRGDFNSALDFYTELTKRYPTNPLIWDERGRALRRLGRKEEAISCSNISIMIDPNNSESWFAKGQYLYDLQRYDDSLDCFDKALSLAPNESNIWFGKGISLHKKGMFEEALECFNKSIQINPKAELAYHFKGVLLTDLGKIEEALECFNKSLEIDPNSCSPWNDKGLLLRKEGKAEEAIECFNKAIALFPSQKLSVLGFEEMWNNKGLSLFDLGKVEEAIECFNKAIAINPTNNKPLYNKASTLASLQRYEEALGCLDREIEKNPNSSDAWSNKASILSDQGKFAESLASCDKAIDINPNNESAWITKTAVLLKLQRHGESIECCDKAIQLISKTYPTGADKNTLLHQLKDFREAIKKNRE